MPAGKLYRASVFGQFLPVIWLGVLGATLATVSGDVDPGQLIVNSFGGLAMPVLLLVIHGPIATNILNIYSASVCALTLDIKVDRKIVAYVVGVFATAFAVWLVFQNDFASSLDGWLASMVTWVAPWGAVMLVHFYWMPGSRSTSRPSTTSPARSRLGDYRWDAIAAFLVGIVATWFFESASRRLCRARAPRCSATSTCRGWPARWRPASSTPWPARGAAPPPACRPRTSVEDGGNAAGPGRTAARGRPDLVDLEVRGRPVHVRVVPHDPGTTAAPVDVEIDAAGALVSPPFVEPHIHLDAALTAGEPRWNRTGTLWEGIAVWSERKPHVTREDVLDRAEQVLRWQAAHGVLHVRSHCDVTDPRLVALDALVELRDRVRDVIGLQIVAFPQEGIFSFPDGEEAAGGGRPPRRGRGRCDSALRGHP